MNVVIAKRTNAAIKICILVSIIVEQEEIVCLSLDMTVLYSFSDDNYAKFEMELVITIKTHHGIIEIVRILTDSNKCVWHAANSGRKTILIGYC